MMISFTLSFSTANWMTDKLLMSLLTTKLATLRCTNISPGCKPVISSAGTLESEQPIHRYRGVCFSAMRWK